MAERKDLLMALEMLTGGDEAPVPERLRPEALQVFERSRPWTMSEGMQGLGIAEKVTDGQRLDEVVLKVYVERKLPKSKLDHAVPTAVQVPGVGEKIATDVEEIGLVEKETFTGRLRPAIPGIGVGHVNVSVGTFGCLVRKRGDANRLYILSNSHVLADDGAGAKGDAVIQPGDFDGGQAPGDVIAELADWVPFEFTLASFPNTVDAAIARVKNKNQVRSAIRLIGVPQGISRRLRRGMRVQKTGRTTDYTQGIIRDTDYRLALDYKRPQGDASGKGRVGLRDQVLCTRYTAGGDSGSAVLSMTGRVVGLHFAGSPSTSIFNKIGNVLDSLNIEVVTEDI